MRSIRHTFRPGLALMALACALVAFPAAATAQSTPGQDLRSPDARDAGLTPIAQDLRSPDTRDAAVGDRSTLAAGTVSIPRARQAHAPMASGTGFDWTDALVGAAAALGVVLLAGAGVLLARRHAHRDQPAAV